MDTDSLSIARWQFRMAWGLAEDFYLDRLTDEVCLWLPHPDSWTVRDIDDGGHWAADWAEPEPVNAPPPSVGWLTWHILWWWSDALAVLRGDRPRLRTEVHWPGTAPGVVIELRKLAAEWDDATRSLDSEALNRPAAYPWREERPLIYTLAWVPVELMKNVAEIGAILNLHTIDSVNQTP